MSSGGCHYIENPDSQVNDIYTEKTFDPINGVADQYYIWLYIYFYNIYGGLTMYNTNNSSSNVYALISSSSTLYIDRDNDTINIRGGIIPGSVIVTRNMYNYNRIRYKTISGSGGIVCIVGSTAQVIYL